MYTRIYILFFILIALTGRYNSWLQLPPASIHQWRQADGAALAGHYAQNPKFWEPEVQNLFYAGDAHTVGEFPLLYWISGLASRRLGWPEYPLRWIGLLLLFAGGWAFGWIALQLTKRPLVAALGSGLFLTAPILSYYGPGFLPDAPAFCFVLLMLASLVRADQGYGKRWLAVAAVCAAMSVLLKLSMALVPIALGLTWGLGRWQRRRPQRSLWSGRLPLLPLTGVAGIVAGFYGWAAQYNAAHQTAYFLTSTRPVWNYDWPFIWETLVLIFKSGLPVYASGGLYIAMIGSLWLTLKHWRTTPRGFRQLLVFTALGGAAYFLLWFRMFREHDYYALCLLALPALLLLNGLRLAVLYFDGRRVVFALSLCCLTGIAHNGYVMSKRLNWAYNPPNSQHLPVDAFLEKNELTEAAIPAAARVLCPEDPSPNIALLALRRQGWTAYNFGDRITADTLYKYQNSFGLTHLALRDTALYRDLYRRFFPRRVCSLRGWHCYGR